VQRHEAPVLLRTVEEGAEHQCSIRRQRLPKGRKEENRLLDSPVNHRINQVAVRDRIRRLGHQFKLLEREVVPRRLSSTLEVALEVVLLKEERHDRVVLEVNLDFVGEGHAGDGRESLRTHDLVVERPWGLNRVLLVHLGAEEKGRFRQYA
jgi:hypothetical protein